MRQIVGMLQKRNRDPGQMFGIKKKVESKCATWESKTRLKLTLRLRPEGPAATEASVTRLMPSPRLQLQLQFYSCYSFGHKAKVVVKSSALKSRIVLRPNFLPPGGSWSKNIKAEAEANVTRLRLRLRPDLWPWDQIYGREARILATFGLGHWPAWPLKKVKFSHTRYRALGPELIPVYRQSARRWLEVNHAIYPVVGCHYFLPGLRLPP